MEKSLYFNHLHKEKLEKQEDIASHNFKHFLESFEYSSNESPKQKKLILQDLGNILHEKAHNLCIFHTNSSKKRQSPAFSLDFKENYTEILKGDHHPLSENPIFIEEKMSFSNLSQENSENSNKNLKKNEVWRRLQVDRKATQLQREILKQKNEEKQVCSYPFNFLTLIIFNNNNVSFKRLLKHALSSQK